MSIFITATTCLLDKEGGMREQEPVKIGNYENI
jgi:hypothetical protein